MKLPAELVPLLRCPRCHAGLNVSDDAFRCIGDDCAARFPIVDGVPVMIDDDDSVFTIDDFVQQRNLFFNLRPSRAARILNRLTPDISKNIKGRENYDRLARLLAARQGKATLLVLGGSVLGEGMEALLRYPALQIIESDVSFGPRTQLICDAHDIPFDDCTVDGVVVQAVLEHVADPPGVVEEIYRVLKPDGLVYAETPFMQQMHGGRYDFERFSYWGHRRLFRRFAEIASGVVCGPGMALAWSYTYFLLSFVSGRRLRHLVRWFASLTAFWLKYLDHLLVNRPGAIAAASGYYFLGRKSQETLSDRDLVERYKPGL